MTEKTTLTDVLLWLSLAVMWSSSYTVIKIGVEDLDPIIMVAGRLWIGVFVMAAILRAQKMSLSRQFKDWSTYLVSGLIGTAIPFFLITYGEQSVDSALASIFMGVTPVVTAFFASILFPDEALTPRIILGLCCGFAGIILLVGPSALLGIGDNLPGQVAIITAAVCYAVTTLYVRKYVTRPALEMATGSMLVAAIVMTVPVPFIGFEPHTIDLTANAIGSVLYLGIFPTALAYLAYFYLVPRLGATRLAQVNFAIPIGGALLGVFILSEPMTTDRWAALGIICVAILLVTSRPKG